MSTTSVASGLDKRPLHVQLQGHRKDKEILIEFDSQVKDIRQQLNEQLKCLDVRTETQVAIVGEIQEYFRRRAEVELEYSRGLEKLAKTLSIRHKAEKQKREQWHLFSTYNCWQELISTTKRQSHDHAVLSELYSNNMINRFTQTMEDVQRMYKRCREIGYEGHEELLKVLHELHTAMKTYHTYHGEMKQMEGKLRYVESQRTKLEQSIPKEKLEKSKKFRLIEKEIFKRQSKFNDTKMKAVKARNEYLLCMDAANAAIHKYFVDDLSDLVDCMDFGFHNCMARSLMLCVNGDEGLKRSRQQAIDSINKCIANLDSRVDKQRFFEYNNTCFMLPKKFEFQAHKGDEVSEFCTDKNILEELEQRHRQLSKRLTALKTESEEIWKTLETAEKSLMDMINIKDYDCASIFTEDEKMSIVSAKQPEAIAIKLRADRQETEDFYLNKFREYTLGSNLIARLLSKYDLMRKALGDHGTEHEAIGPPMSRTSGTYQPLPKLTHSHQSASSPTPPTTVKAAVAAVGKPRRKRIGRTPLVGQPKLFGGSLEEYLEATNQEIPLIMRSCIRIINLYGLHHQGIFRVSGSQLEINNFKETFEREEDPLSDMTDASDINSVAGLLKLYLRELREPLFPIYYFDQFMEISQLESKTEFVTKVRDLVISLPRPVFVVMRYLFAFLNHLSEFSDENMMDPYNLAICFGPTLLPIPEDRDQVQFQNLVNELIKNIIIYQEEIFVSDGGITYEKYISINVPDYNDVGEAPAEHVSEDESDLGCTSEDAEQEAKGERDISLQLFGKTEVLEAVAQFDFTARSERELTFKKGDALTLYNQVSNDWWKGSFEGTVGLIPDKYIMLKMRDEDRDKATSDDSGKPRRTSSSSDSYCTLSPKPRHTSNRGSSGDSLEVGRGMALTHSASASHIGSLACDSTAERTITERAHKRSRSPSTGSLHHTPTRQREGSSHHLAPIDVTTSTSVPTDATAPMGSLSPLGCAPDPNLEHDLDSALAQVFSSLETLEKKKRNKDAPDLVLDLPVNPSSPTSGTGKEEGDSSPGSMPDSPELATAAERFAQSNQCTMKKGGSGGGSCNMSRSTTHVSSLSSDAQTQTVMKRSTSTSGDGSLDMRVETIQIRSPARYVAERTRSADDGGGGGGGGSSSTVSTFKPTVKVKPPVMKKPTAPISPTSDCGGKLPERELKQTSC